MTKLPSGPIHESAAELAKLTVKRFAAINKSVTLQDGFWNDPVWKKTFREHCIAASALLKLYSFKAIHNVLYQQSKVWSLRARWLHEYLEQEQRRLDALNLNTETLPDPNTEKSQAEKIRLKTFGRKDNGEEERY